MSKLAIYAMVVIQSIFMAMASKSDAQGKLLEEIPIRIVSSADPRPLMDLLSEIEANGEFTFAYSKRDVKGKLVQLFSEDWTMESLMKEISVQGRFSIRRVNETITLNPVVGDKLPDVHDDVIDINIAGKVVGFDGEGLPGVSILVRGTTLGTTTGIDGSFSLVVPSEESVLVVSFVGFSRKEVVIGNQTYFEITLDEDVTALEEVVVIGYGTVKKSDLTGAVASVSGDEIQSVPAASFDQSLQGKVPGVLVTQTSGAPGAGISMRVRGGKSIGAGNEPLYVVDGIPIYSNNNQLNPGDGNFNIGEEQNALSTINPNDIESIEVLKDASATAIYGSRGSNGVVIITTKRGSEGKPTIDFEAYYGVQEVIKTFDLLGGAEHLMMKNEQLFNLGIPKRFGEGGNRFPQPLAEYPSTDWQDEIFRVAPIQNYQLSLSGGSKNNKYYMSANYFDQEGIIINSGFKRYSLRFNSDHAFSDKLKLTNSVLLSRTDNNPTIDGTESVLFNALTYSPSMPVFDENGDYSINFGPGSGLDRILNPVMLANESDNSVISDRVLANIAVNYEIIEGLNLRIALGGDFYNSQRKLFFPNFFDYGRMAVNENGSAVSSFIKTSNLLNENTLNYATSFGGDHRLEALLGVTYQSQVAESSTAQVNDFITNVTGADNLSVGAAPQPVVTNKARWGINSYLSRVNYVFKERYLFTFTGRVDGSSRLGENNKYGFFPSGAMAWKIMEEPFMSGTSLFSDLKLRVSYGLTGNQEIGMYRSLSRLGTTRTIFNNGDINLGVFPGAVANPDLRWEKTSQFNIGVESGFFYNRLQLTMDFYHKVTDDLLLEVDLPTSSGFGSALKNVGSLTNTGVELSLNAIILDNAFSWTFNGNIAYNRNEVTNIGSNEEIILRAGGIGSSNIITPGESVASFYGLVWDGIWESQEQIDQVGIQPNASPGDWRFKDVNGDGVYNEGDDRQIIGDGLPDYVFGFTNNFEYKGFDLGIFFQGVAGNEILNLNRRLIEDGQPGQNMLRTVLNRWTQDQPSNTNPRMAARHPNTASTFLIEDGSFLRLRNLTLGYTFSQGLFENTFLNGTRIYFTGQNLWTLTDYRGFDPEVNSMGQDNVIAGIDFRTYPKFKSYILGFSLKF